MDITRSSLLSTILYSALLVALFWWGDTSAIEVQSIPENVFGDRWNLVNDLFHSIGIDSIARMIGAILMFFNSLVVARIAVREVMYLERSYMPSVIYVLISSSVFTSSQSIAPLLSSLLLALASSEAIRSYRFKTLATRNIFSSALYFGISALIFPPSAYFIPLIFVALSLFRLLDIREWITAIVAATLPVALYFFALWATGGDTTTQWELFTKALTLSDGTVKIAALHSVIITRLVFSAICALLLILAIIRFTRKGRYYKRYSRLSFTYFLTFTLWATAVVYVSPVRSLIMVPILALPLSVIIPTYFAGSRPTLFTNFIYILLLLSAVGIHLLGEINL